MTARMRCGYCGESKRYPYEFPNSSYAKCWWCSVEQMKDDFRFSLRVRTFIAGIVGFILGWISLNILMFILGCR